MSELHQVGEEGSRLPDAAAIGAILEESGSATDAGSRGRVADALVGLAGREPHPLARAALLERAAALVVGEDRERAALLLRESFRHAPQSATGARLIELADADASLGRFGRMADVVDAVAALSPIDARHYAWLEAARRHVELGYGARAVAALERIDGGLDASMAQTADELREVAESQRTARDEALGGLRLALGEANEASMATALVDYAEMLVVGDEPPGDVAAVLADAAEAGADPERIAALWAESSRAAGRPALLAKALAAALATEQPMHIRLRTADELANLPDVDRTAPEALIVALDALSEALPDDLGLRARSLAARALAGEDEAEPALELLRGEAVRARDRQAEAIAALGLARIARDKGDAERADRMLRRVRTLDPDNREALDHFEQRYRESESWERLYVLLGQRVDNAAADDQERALAAALEMAQLAEGPLASPERAAEAWHRVLTLAPDHDVALARLAAHERESGDAVLLADLLERRATIAEARGDREAAAEALDELARLLADDGELPDPTARLGVLHRLAAASPGRSDVTGEVKGALRTARRWDELAALLEAQIEGGAEGSSRCNAAAELLALHLEQREDAPLAARAAEVLLQEEDVPSSALEALLAYGRATGGETQVRTALCGKATRSGDAATDLLCEAADAAADAGLGEQALALLRDAVDARPEALPRRLRLGVMLEAAGAHADAVGVLEAGRNKAGEGDPDLIEAIVRARLATGDEGDALTADLEALRSARPASPLLGEAELRLALGRQDAEAARAAAAKIGQDAEAIADAVEAEAGQSDDLHASRRLIFAAALTGDANRAADLAASALARAMSSADGEAILAAAHASLGRAEAIDDKDATLVALAALADHGSGDAKTEALNRRLDLASELGALDQAFAAATELLVAQLENDDATAAGRVADLAEAMGEPGLAVELLAGQATARLATIARETAWMVLDACAELALRSGASCAEAAAGVRAWIDAGETDANAWSLYERLATEAGDWNAAIDAIEASVAGCEPSEAADRYLRAATMASSHGAEPTRCAALWDEVVTRRPEASEAWIGLIDARRSIGDTEALATSLDALLAAGPDDVNLCCRAFLERVELPGGDADDVLLGAAAAPMRLLAASATISAEGEAVLSIVAARMDLPELAERAATLVAPVARAHGRHDELARALEVAPAATDADARVQQLLDMAELADAQLADGERAFAALHEAICLRPLDDNLWHRADDLARRRGLTHRVDALLGSLAGLDDQDADAVAARDVAQRGALLLRLAERAHAAGRLDHAARAYEALVEISDPQAPEHRSTLTALALLWREAKDADALCSVLERRVQATADAEERVMAWLELAEAHREERSDPSAAATALQRATADLPASLPLWEARLDALRGRDEHALLAALQERLGALGEDETGVELRVASWREIATLQHDPSGGLSAWLEVLAIDPTDDDAARAAAAQVAIADAAQLTTLATIFAARGDDDALDATLARSASLASGPERTALLQELATLRAEKRGDQAGALQALIDALATSPDDEALAGAVRAAAERGGADATAIADALGETDASGTAIDALRLEVLAGSGRWEAVVAAHLARAEDGGDGAAQARREAARLSEEKLGDAATALALWTASLSENPDDDDALAAVFRLADQTEEAAETDAVVAEVARAATAERRSAIRMQLAERAMARSATEPALALLDELIADGAGEDAFAMRGALLESAGDADRLRAHFEQGVEIAGEPALRTARLLAHADHLAQTGAADRAFATLCAEIERTEDPSDRAELVAIAVPLADDAGLTLDAAALLAIEAARSSGDEASRRYLDAARRADSAADVGRAAGWAAAALDAADGLAAEAAACWAQWTADAALLDDRGRLDRAVDALAPADAVALLERAISVASEEDALQLRERQAGVADDPTVALRALALAIPDEPARWQALSEALGEDRRDELLEALLVAADRAQEPTSRAALLERAAEVALAGDDAETGAAWLKLAHDAAPTAERSARLQDLLQQTGQIELLAEVLEADAGRQDDAGERRVLLQRALELREMVEDDAATLATLQRLAALGGEPAERLRQRLDLLKTADPAAYRAALADAADGDTDAREELLFLELRAALGRSDRDAAFAALAAARADGWRADDAAILCEILDAPGAMAAEAERALLRAAADTVDPTADPTRWASVRLQLSSGEEDDQAQLAGLDALVAHADGPLDDPGLALEWSVRALLLAAGDRDRQQTLLARCVDAATAEAALPALAVSLSMHVDGAEAADAEAAHRLVQLLGESPDLEDAIGQRQDDPAFALAALDGLTAALRRAGATPTATALEQAALRHAGDEDRVRVARALTAAAADDSDGLGAALEAVTAVADDPAFIGLADGLLDAARQANLADRWLDMAEIVVARDDVEIEIRKATAGLAAGVALAELDDAARAADLWARIWDHDPGDRDARDAVLAMRRAAGDPGRLAADLDRAVMAGGDDVGDLARELASLLIDPIGRPRAALVHLRTQLEAEPTDEASSALVEQLSAQPQFARDALDVLVKAYRARGDHAGLADALERRVQVRGDAASAGDLREIASLLSGPLHKPAQAKKAASRAAAVSRDTASADVLLGAALASDEPDEVARAAAAALEMGLSEAAELDMARRAEAFFAAHAAEHPGREAVLRAIVRHEPGTEEAWVALDAMLDAAGRWEDLLTLRRERLAHVEEPIERIAHLNEIAGLAAARERYEIAIEAYSALGVALEDDPTPFETLSELLANTSFHLPRAEALEALAGRLDGRDRIRALCEAARLRHGPAHDRDGAARLYAVAFAEDPAVDEAFVFLEKAASGAGELVALLQRRADAMEPGPSRVVVLRKLAAQLSDLGDHAGARAALAKALADAPDNDALSVELLEACEDAGDWAGFRDIAARRLEGALPRPERLLLLRKLARMAVDQHDDAERWVKALEQAVPGDNEAASLRGLMASQSDDPETAAAGLEKVVRETEDPTRRAGLLTRLVQLYDGTLHQDAKTISALQRLLQVEPRRLDAHARLCELYAARGSHEALAEALRHWHQALPEDHPERASVSMRLGTLLLEFGDDEKARPLLTAALAGAPHDPEVLAAAALMHTRSGEFEAAVDLQLRAVDRLRRTGQKDAWPVAAGRAGALLERVGRHEEARGHYRSALAASPNDVETLLGMGRVCLRLGDVGRALTEFERVAQMSDDSATPTQRAEAQVGLGHGWLRQGKKSQARTAFNRALELRPGMREALDGLSGA